MLRQHDVDPGPTWRILFINTSVWYLNFFFYITQIQKWEKKFCIKVKFMPQVLRGRDNFCVWIIQDSSSFKYSTWLFCVGSSAETKRLNISSLQIIFSLSVWKQDYRPASVVIFTLREFKQLHICLLKFDFWAGRLKRFEAHHSSMPFSSLTVVMLVGSSVTFSLLHLGSCRREDETRLRTVWRRGWGTRSPFRFHSW